MKSSVFCDILLQFVLPLFHGSMLPPHLPIGLCQLRHILSCVMQLAVQYLALNSAAFNCGPLSVLIISPCVLRFPSSNCLFSATMKSLSSSSLHFISSISTFFNSIIFLIVHVLSVLASPSSVGILVLLISFSQTPLVFVFPLLI